MTAPVERLFHQLTRIEPTAPFPAALGQAQQKAGVIVVDAAAYSAMSLRALPLLGERSSFPVGGDAPIFDALMAKLGPFAALPDDLVEGFDV